VSQPTPPSPTTTRSRVAIEVEFAPELALFVPARRRNGRTQVITDGTSSLGHVVESLGVPLTEVGRLLAGGLDRRDAEVHPSYVPRPGDHIAVRPVPRPQPVPGDTPRFLLDVHLGTLARRLRLLGVDAAYDSDDPGDPALAARSAADRRVLLTRDRGLLRRREVWLGAYVYSDRPDDQLRDILARFTPPLAPWTRCTACNGTLVPATKEEVMDRLEGGTRATQDVFAACTACDHVYWRGAHSDRLAVIVEGAMAEFGDRS
jgi:uncharacterized protein with PIN domain